MPVSEERHNMTTEPEQVPAKNPTSIGLVLGIAYNSKVSRH